MFLLNVVFLYSVFPFRFYSEVNSLIVVGTLKFVPSISKNFYRRLSELKKAIRLKYTPLFNYLEDIFFFTNAASYYTFYILMFAISGDHRFLLYFFFHFRLNDFETHVKLILIC